MTTEIYGCGSCGAYEPDTIEIYDDEGMHVDNRCVECGALASKNFMLIASDEEDRLARIEERER